MSWDLRSKREIEGAAALAVTATTETAARAPMTDVELDAYVDGVKAGVRFMCIALGVNAPGQVPEPPRVVVIEPTQEEMWAREQVGMRSNGKGG
jgi:hypothetical protein